MKKITIKKNVLLLLCSLFFATNLFAQELMIEVPLSEQVQNSSQIVEGKVLSKVSYWDANQQNIYTVNTVEVYKVFKGQATSTIEVITSGGTVGLNAEIVTPSLNLDKGDVGLFLLTPSTRQLSETSSLSRFQSNSSAQGFYEYDFVSNTATNPFQIRNGITSELYSEITTITNSNFTTVSNNNIDEIVEQYSNQRNTMAVFSFSPTTITGGTKSVLTINGVGFGTNQGSVQFRDANDGGSSFIPVLDTQILSWSDSQVTVEVPSRAGTGTFRVVSAFNSISNSPTALTIPFSEINVTSEAVNPGTPVAYQTQHIDDNGNGGYTWQMYLSFSTNTAANESFTRAFDNWVCTTGVNWVIGAPTTTNVIADDGINIIRFDVGSELPNGVLGRCTSRFSGCFINGNTSLDWFVSELDIVFDSAISWNYGPGNPGGSQYDFESVAVHELGHGHQMAHVINTGAIMHYSIGNGQVKRVLSTNDIDGGENVQSRSTTNVVCGNGLMTNSACSLSVDDNFLSQNLSLYPIPTKNELTIKTSSGISLNDGMIYNVRGQLLSTINLNDGNNIKTIDVSNLSSGIYFIKLNSDTASITKKFVIE